MDPQPRILYIDAYDSFSNNIVGLLSTQLSVDISVTRIDDPVATKNLLPLISTFDAIVVGPGPGHPANPSDVGLINQLWDLPETHVLPILGICLGFQSLALAAGAQITRMARPRHGLVHKVVHAGTDVFEGVGAFEATQYHSLCADIGHPVQAGVGLGVGAAEGKGEEKLWVRTERCPLLQPLAWDLSDGVNGPVLMAVRHVVKPFWGVQFHPESICTTLEGNRVVCKWWDAAKAWLKSSGRLRKLRTSLLGVSPSATNFESKPRPESSVNVDKVLRSHLPGNEGSFLWVTHPLGAATVVDLCEAMGLTDKDAVILDSQGHHSGRYSIVGLVSQGAGVKLAYTAHDRRLLVSANSQPHSEFQIESIDNLWPLLQRILDRHTPTTDQLPQDSPFWGGWMGYISYEAGLETLDVKGLAQTERHAPDVNFAFVERSIVIDHTEKQVYLQSLIPGDHVWLLETGKIIDGLSGKFGSNATTSDDDGFSRLIQMLSDSTSEDKLFNAAMERSYIDRPEKDAYCKKVLECQESLSAGDSYELCLTDETQICIPRTPTLQLSPWTIYKKLRKNNPAPFGCFIRLPRASIVGSSPERFLRWTRTGRCQFRPIKGTVRKTPDVDFAAASAILNTSKERAENLMIVDLIRHDLSGVVGARSCTVPKLMQVEEYQTVYQLVSVIEGQIPDGGASAGAHGARAPRGIDVLKASLPPGSMTGAPKKRSCEILADLERRPRGIYSGVIGYMDVGGAGDFSVVIRTAMKWDGDCVMRPLKGDAGSRTSDNGDMDSDVTGAGDEGTLVPHDVWRIGAGGAVTIQSTDVGEFNEMETKLDSVLKTFQV